MGGKKGEGGGAVKKESQVYCSLSLKRVVSCINRQLTQGTAGRVEGRDRFTLEATGDTEQKPRTNP